MNAILKQQSRLTDRYQTTIPGAVRKILNLNKGDHIQYIAEADGRVYLAPVQADTPDLALGSFLDLIEADITSNPERLQAFGGALHDRLSALVGDVEIDLDAPLSADDE